MSNIIDSIQLSGVTYTIQGSGGGGKAIEAGRGISVTTGATADTVSFNLPISAGTRSNSIIENFNGNVASGAYSHAEGFGTITNNEGEHASGKYNVSHTGSTEADNTLFSVGNGTYDEDRRNAFEIREDGSIFISSGYTTIKLQDHIGGGGNPTVELTQAEYEALVTAGTVSADTYYIITDAQAGDLTNYYTKTETNTLLGGKADTATTYTKTETDNAITAATSTKQDTLVSGTNIKTINNESILGSGNITIEGGGGKAINAGTNISVTTGETADTINCTLPITKIQGRDSVIIGDSRNTVDGNANVAVGYENSINARGGSYIPDHCFVGGQHNNVYNTDETAFGLYNNSVQNTLVGGESGTTLFSVGNGKSNSARHNAFEIRLNGDIYLNDGSKLQDTVSATAANTTALGGLKLVKLSQSEYDSLATKDNSILYVIVN